MKDIYKEPVLYYILVPIALILWPLFVWGIYLPDAERSWKGEKAQYEKAQKTMEEILILDPDRLTFADTKADAAKFDYADAVDRIARLCKIPSTKYKLSSGIIITSGGQKSRSAKVVLKQVGITKFAEFLSKIQLRWANLQCTKLKLTRAKGLPDTWNADLEFKYYY